MNPLSKVLTTLDIKEMLNHWSEIIKEAQQNDPYDGYKALDYYDGEKIYLYKPEPLTVPYKINWEDDK